MFLVKTSQRERERERDLIKIEMCQIKREMFVYKMKRKNNMFRVNNTSF